MATERNSTASRSAIVTSITTPLGFFTLVVLVVEVLFGGISVVAAEDQRTVLIWAMIIFLAVLVLLVGGLACFRPEALRGKRYRPPLDGAQESLTASECQRVNNPRVLCICTKQFEALNLGIEEDVRVLKAHFGRNVDVLRDATSSTVRDAMTTRKYAIVHLVGYVDTQTGNLSFSDTDVLRPDGFAKLIELASSLVVVIASCDSVQLGARLARVTSMIAATSVVMTTDIAAWADCFYRLLAKGQPLSKAYDIASSTTNAPMVLMLKREFAVN